MKSDVINSRKQGLQSVVHAYKITKAEAVALPFHTAYRYEDLRSNRMHS
jgi:hypothetical protein